MQHDKLKRKREIFDILSTEIFEFSSDQILLIFVILWEQTAKVSGSEQKNLNNNKFLPLHSSLLVSVLALVLIVGCLNEILFPSKCRIKATVYAIETCLVALQRFVYFLTTSLHTLNNFSTSQLYPYPPDSIIDQSTYVIKSCTLFLVRTEISHWLVKRGLGI